MDWFAVDCCWSCFCFRFGFCSGFDCCRHQRREITKNRILARMCTYNDSIYRCCVCVCMLTLWIWIMPDCHFSHTHTHTLYSAAWEWDVYFQMSSEIVAIHYSGKTREFMCCIHTETEREHIFSTYASSLDAVNESIVGWTRFSAQFTTILSTRRGSRKIILKIFLLKIFNCKKFRFFPSLNELQHSN